MSSTVRGVGVGHSIASKVLRRDVSIGMTMSRNLRRTLEYALPAFVQCHFETSDMEELVTAKRCSRGLFMTEINFRVLTRIVSHF